MQGIEALAKNGRTGWLAGAFGVAVLTAGMPIAAQTQRRVSLEVTPTEVIARIQPPSESGQVLLSSGGRILGYRPVLQGEARWSTAELPAGDYVITAGFRGARSQPAVHAARNNPVERFSEAEDLASTPSEIRALTV